MKAITQRRYGSADVLALADIDKPSVGGDELLIEVRAAGVDPSVWHLMTGLPLVMRLMGFGLRAPRNPVRGRDLGGRVAAVGANVTLFRPGDSVFGTGDGSFAEFARAREDTLAPMPANLSFEQAAAVPTSACTALKGLRDAGHVQPGQRVLIIGAGGGIGTFAVQLAKAFGAHVTGGAARKKSSSFVISAPTPSSTTPETSSRTATRRTTSSSTLPATDPCHSFGRPLAPREPW